jgi:predicted nucleic acid-binding protein
VIVVDTNVVSELMKSAPAAPVLAWLDATPEHDLYTTSITVAEVRYGIERLPRGRRRNLLTGLAGEVFGAFEDRVLPFDVRAAALYATVVAERERAGRPNDGFDAQIASICRTHRATLATRNTRDFEKTGIDTRNPWR